MHIMWHCWWAVMVGDIGTNSDIAVHSCTWIHAQIPRHDADIQVGIQEFSCFVCVSCQSLDAAMYQEPKQSGHPSHTNTLSYHWNQGHSELAGLMIQVKNVQDHTGVSYRKNHTTMTIMCLFILISKFS